MFEKVVGTMADGTVSEKTAQPVQEEGMSYKKLEELNRLGLTIRLGGPVNEDMVKSFRTQQKEVYKALKDAPAKESAILLTTTGGAVQCGLELYNLIRSFRLGGVDRLWLVGSVTVASAGLIVLAGQPDQKYRAVFSETQTYHHRTSMWRERKIEGPAMVHEYEIAEQRANLKKHHKTEALLNKLFAEMTGCSEERLKYLEEHPCHLSPKKAIKYGFYGSLVT